MKENRTTPSLPRPGITDTSDRIVSRRTLLKTGAASVLGVSAMGTAAAQSGSTTHISSAPYTIDSPGRYVVTADLSTADECCIKIRASDVVLDGRSHTLTGTGTCDGVQAKGNYSNVRVKSLVTRKWKNGVYFQGLRNSKLWNVVTVDNDRGVAFERGERNELARTHAFRNTTGLRFRDETNSRIACNVTNSNRDQGIQLFVGSDDNFVVENEAADNRDGIVTFRSGGNTILRNTVTSSAISGVRLDESESNVLRLNDLLDNRFGIHVDQSDSSDLLGNRTLENHRFGILLAGSNDCRVVNNRANENADDGVHLGESNRNRVVDNIASRNGGDGIDLAGSDDNRVRRNTTCGNSGQAIRDAGSGNQLLENQTNC